VDHTMRGKGARRGGTETGKKVKKTKIKEAAPPSTILEYPIKRRERKKTRNPNHRRG